LIKQKPKEYADVLLDAIDEAFATLGEASKSAIYLHLQSNFGISKQEIPRRMSDFSNALEEIFGSAAKQLQILIMKYLNQKVNASYKWVGPPWLVPELTFEKYVALMEVAYKDEGKVGKVEILIDDGEKHREEV
jgi:hypothetical protein